MQELGLDKIKEIEYHILEEFDRLCKNNSLYYALHAGTLLGAIRHQGFIPWDDDIDVSMPRYDYDRLLHNKDIDYTGFPEYLKVERWTDDTSDYPFIKVVDKRTKLNAQYYDDSHGTQHVWIDVFPMDGVPNNADDYQKLYKKLCFYIKILCSKMAKVGEGTTLLKRLVKPIVKIMAAPVSVKKLCYKIDELAKHYSYHTSEKLSCVIWGYDLRDPISRNAYEKATLVKFESGEFNAPSNYEEYLSNTYGDYMTLPPEDQRVTHDITVFMESTERSRDI